MYIPLLSTNVFYIQIKKLEKETKGQKRIRKDQKMKIYEPQTQKQIMKVCKSKCHYYFTSSANNGCVQLIIHATTHGSQTA